MKYLQLRAAPARQLLTEAPSVTVLSTEGIGYVGAVSDDQARWSTGFRRLLDALGGPLQVVLRFRREERESLTAQRREVLLAVETDSVAGLRAALAGLGLSVANEPPPSVSHTFGDELPRTFRDRFGWHRTWYVDHFPGGELEPGWLLAPGSNRPRDRHQLARRARRQRLGGGVPAAAACPPPRIAARW